MLLRIRSPSGTHRVEVSDSGTVNELKRKIFEAISVPEDDQLLSTNPAGTTLLLDGSQKLNTSVKHGDMLYLITEAPAAKAASGSSSSAQLDDKPKCTHGPNAKCVYCSTSDNTPAPKKCNHGPNEMCLNCQPVHKKSNKKIEWLCTHPPGGKCVNCMRVPKKVSHKCNHPPHMVCPNCMYGAKQDKEKLQLTSKCNHGPNGACATCRPFVPEDEAKPSFKCRNHGPHGSCIECIEREERLKMRLKLQDSSHCTSAAIDYQAASTFQNYLQEKKFLTQRVGLLYGKFKEDGSAVIDVIYEPPQTSTKAEATMLPDPDKDRVESIASMLGLQRVGWIFSHPKRDYVMSSAEIIRAAELQNQSGAGFVTLILSFNEKNVGNLEAFQVSDQALKLQREGMFLDSPDPAKILLRQPVVVEGAETKSVDYHFFLVTVPINSSNSFLKTEFHIENRQPPQAKSDLKVHMMHTAKRAFVEQLSDFHLLLFLSKGYFDLNTDMPALCDAVRTRKADHLEGFKILLESFAS
jgi:nuclear protein localization family protein 4